MSLINFIGVPNIEVYIRSFNTTTLGRALSSALSCLSTIYLHQLLVIDDEEFSSPLIHQNIDILTTFIPDIVGWLHESFWIRNGQLDLIMRINQDSIGSVCIDARNNYPSFFWYTLSQFSMSSHRQSSRMLDSRQPISPTSEMPI